MVPHCSRSKVLSSTETKDRGTMGILNAHFLKHSWVLLRNPRSQRLLNRNKIDFENLWESLRKLRMQRSANWKISTFSILLSVITLENVSYVYNWKKNPIKNYLKLQINHEWLNQFLIVRKIDDDSTITTVINSSLSFARSKLLLIKTSGF